MKDFELINLLLDKTGCEGKEITVFLPNIGSAFIEDVKWHASCQEFHILLKTEKCKHEVKTWKGEVGSRMLTCDECGKKC